MYKLYNFEAIFALFLKSLKISRNGQKRYLAFFRSFINWLHYSLEATIKELSAVAFLGFLSSDSLSKYREFLQKSKLPKTSIEIRIEILEQFRLFLETHSDSPIIDLKNPEIVAEMSILDDFIAELEDKGAKPSAIRSYRSDIAQFLFFLRNYEPVQRL